ncbi:MAG: spore germination protein, partial [Lachnospiraceae bacterium]|nr:spore germination protein [Lachnospiraceae bacterium]
MDTINGNNFYADTKERLYRELGVKDNFDIICKGFYIGGKRSDFFFVDGFIKDGIMEKMMAFWNGIQPDAMPKDAEGVANNIIPYVEVDVI